MDNEGMLVFQTFVILPLLQIIHTQCVFENQIHLHTLCLPSTSLSSTSCLAAGGDVRQMSPSGV